MSKQFVVSIVLATGVVAAAIWVADQSLTFRSSQNAAVLKEPRSGGEHGARSSQDIVPHRSEVLESAAVANSSSLPPSGIVKCIVEGKTVYSDNGCPDGAKRQAVALHHSAGIISPPKEDLAELTAKRKAAESAYALQARTQTLSIGRSGNMECEALEKRITDLDSMARQPHSGVMQDWIREERKAIRNQQFSIHC